MTVQGPGKKPQINYMSHRGQGSSGGEAYIKRIVVWIVNVLAS